MHQIKRKLKKDITSEQTKKTTILGDGIVKHGGKYNLSHCLENSKVDVQNFTVTRIKFTQTTSNFFSGKTRSTLFFIHENNISTNKKPNQLANLITEIALSVKRNSFNVTLSNMIISQE